MKFSPSLNVTCLLGLWLGLTTGFAATPEAEFFERRIRPVLAEQCFECHSAESKAVKGGLRLDGRAALLAGGDTGPAIVPGKPGESLLLKALSHADPDLAMPPKKPKLAEAVQEDFARWIADGAPWPQDNAAPVSKKFDLEARKRDQAWLWQSPQRQSLPAVTNTAWPQSPVDQFILARLEQNGLRPAAPVDAGTWLRRVTFGLTGLPPTRGELQEFLADRSPEARERVVDRLLASPHFGERWARHWMDLMRYAETRGHESDFHIANAWQYRDYLIRAFNADVPYPQFLLEHLAGDTLPEPRLRPGTELNESVLATGWAFLGEENHSPVDIRQDECERIDNKVDVFTKSFLGLTVACARCHDHKFDPISTQDYYALTGFLLSSSYRQVRFETMENNRRMAGELAKLREQSWPVLATEVGRQVRSQAATLARAAEVAVGLAEDTSADSGAMTPLVEFWREQFRGAAVDPAHALHPWLVRAVQERKEVSALAPVERTRPEALPAETRVIADFTRPAQQPWKADGEAFGPGPVTPGAAVAVTNSFPFGLQQYGAARRDPFWNRLALAAGNESDSGELAATSRAGQMIRTPTVTLGSGKLHYLVRGRTRVYVGVDSHLMVAGPLHRQLVRRFDTGTSLEPQWVTHDLSLYAGHRAHVEFGPDGEAPLEILMVVEAPEMPRAKPGVPPIPTTLPATGTAWAAGLESALTAASTWLERGAALSAEALPLADLLARQAVNWAGPSEGVRRFEQDQKALADQVQWVSRTAVAWFDGTGVDEFVLVRGKPFKTGPLAPRSLPAAFGSSAPLTNTASSGRYELGVQLMDPANPLVSRTLVNRVWHHLFGRGLVPTVDNFGTLGEPPTHPELLDHLAWQFRAEDQGSVKRLIKRLVLTQTYAMSHRAADPQAEALDPANRLWHRIPVRRLEAEAIRDATLVISGRFDPAVGGPPVPVHLTEFVVGRGRPEKSGPLDGQGRRTLYLEVRRNFLPTTLLTFDAPTPFSTVGRRNVTNVPAQALALMNDPFFHEQAAVWAGRLVREVPAADAEARIRWLYETAFARLPSASELAACQDSLREFRELQGTPDNSPQVWTDLCHALMSANDFIYLL
ncbi:MAG: PSD1 domain-containing protein [Verrucomicrobia bacterium]|nr:PSD1 domain-containing protein [Verrucomicrobiota bacterium]